MRIAIGLSVLGLLLLPVTPALGDWDVGDYHKMHSPQLPDPNGWDVNATYYTALADDWQCSETGTVDDVHIWASWKDDVMDEIEFFHMAIWSNIPADQSPTGYSMPGERLWHNDFYPGEWTAREWGQGLQGWYDPVTGEVLPDNHMGIWQYNFDALPDPLIQQEGEIYWLEVSAKLPLGSTASFGWKTSTDHFMDDAVWGEAPMTTWHDELIDPETQESIDLAFVITPEPTTLGLLALGAVALIRKRR
jgi:hypothetical protein